MSGDSMRGQPFGGVLVRVFREPVPVLVEALSRAAGSGDYGSVGELTDAS